MSKLGYAVGKLAPGIAKISEIDPYEALSRQYAYEKKMYDMGNLKKKQAQEARDAQMEERGQTINTTQRLYMPGAGDALKYARDMLKKNPYMTVGDAIKMGKSMAEREDEEKRLAAAIQYGKWAGSDFNRSNPSITAVQISEKMFRPAMRRGGTPKKFDIREAVMKARRPF